MLNKRTTRDLHDLDSFQTNAFDEWANDSHGVEEESETEPDFYNFPILPAALSRHPVEEIDFQDSERSVNSTNLSDSERSAAKNLSDRCCFGESFQFEPDETIVTVNDDDDEDERRNLEFFMNATKAITENSEKSTKQSRPYRFLFYSFLVLAAAASVLFLFFPVDVGRRIIHNIIPLDMHNITYRPDTLHMDSLRQRLLPISGNILFDSSSNQYRAVQWMAGNGPFKKSGPSLESIYLISFFYFATNGTGWIDPGIFMKSSIPVCDWNDGDSSGLFCDRTGQYIVKIELGNYNLNGTIPSELSYLSSLELLKLGFNDLTGTIPSEIGSFSRMYHFDIQNNHVTGMIPTEVGTIGRERNVSSQYAFFSLANNKLFGSIPSEIGNFPASFLGLSNNSFHGTIPAELFHNSHLLNLEIEDNNLTGTIPTEIGNLRALNTLRLNNNMLSGTVPSELGNISPDQLRVLRLDGNNFLGALPTELKNLHGLTSVNFHNTSITGNINSIFCQYSSQKGEYGDNFDPIFKNLAFIRADISCDRGVSASKITCACCCCRCAAGNLN